MKNNHIIILVAIGIIAGGALYYYQLRGTTNPAGQTNQEALTPSESQDQRLDQRIAPQPKQSAPQAPERFSGKLQEVNTGCFADGECFVTIDGKHVTTTWGWTQEVVGSVKGVEGFGDLEQHIGKNIEVYANKLENGDFTLYGDAAYYIELKK